MSGNLALGLLILSILYSLSLNVLYFTKKHINTNETKIFGYMLGINFVGLLLEVACILSIVSLGTDNFISLLVNRIFLVYHIVFTYTLFLYVVLVVLENQLKEEITKKIIKYSLIAIGIGAVAVFTAPIELVMAEKGCYSTGLGVNIIYGFVTVMIVIIIGLLILNRKAVLNNRKKLTPLFLYLLGMSVVSTIQRINPFLTLSTEMETVLVFLMYNTIENPDLKMVQALELAKETADKANQSKTEFLSSMSHEIRTPLNAIVGFSDCILDAHSVNEAKENAKDIVNASQTLLEIVNGILDISKIEAGKLEIVNTTYNAKELFTELATLITPRMKEKGLDFTYEIDSSLPATLYGDKANLKKIVTNFLSNACKYTDHGFVRYEVHSVRLGDYVRLIISVEDSGRGIKKDSVDQLFTRFQRLDEDKNTTIEGTGLGLAITKQLTELMGGKVIVHTVYGEGSKFTAVINQRIEEMDVQVKQEVFDSLDLQGVKILVVDDAPLNLKVATKLFEKYNANCLETCSSGFDCIEKIMSGNHYDLIFLDDMMPKMSGIETFEKLKQIPNFRTPTIALTANAITGMREKYLACGFDDYIAKPIEQNELIRVCNMILGREDTSSVPKVEEETEKPEVKAQEEKELAEKNKIIPVEDNIEEVLGDMVDLTKDKNAFTSMISKTEILRAIQDDNVEILDEEEEVSTPEIISVEPITPETTPVEEVPPVNPVDILPVVDLDEPEVMEEEEDKNEKYDEAYLRKNGADLEKAMELLGDMEMYNMTVHDFLDEVDDKWRRINDTLAQEDMKNYSIDVHSLKSDCKYLGFMSLADIAYQHELKSKENDLAYCKEHFPELEEEYYRVIDIIRNYADHNPVQE